MGQIQPSHCGHPIMQFRLWEKAIRLATLLVKVINKTVRHSKVTPKIFRIANLSIAKKVAIEICISVMAMYRIILL